jgi:site-specific recombinase XerD
MQTNQNKQPQVTSRKVETLTMFECQQLLNVLLPRTGTPKQLWKRTRNYTLTLLLMDAGLRVGELCQLTIGDLVFNGRIVQSLTIRPEIAKYNIERTIPLSARLQLALADYVKVLPNAGVLQAIRPFFGSGDYRFSITPRQVQRIVAAASLLAFGRKIHPHVLRHTFATKMMRYIDIRGVQDLLGHKQVTSTQIYTHPSAEDKKNAIDKAAEEG